MYFCAWEAKRKQWTSRKERLTVQIKGDWDIQVCDAKSGEQFLEKGEKIIRNDAADRWEKNEVWTSLCGNVFEQDSLLLELTEQETGERQNSVNGTRDKKSAPNERREIYRSLLPEPKTCFLEEDNVLLLDKARYRLDDGAWENEEELLKVDDRLRRRLGYPLRTESQPQPWLLEKKNCTHRVTFRFAIRIRYRL